MTNAARNSTSHTAGFSSSHASIGQAVSVPPVGAMAGPASARPAVPPEIRLELRSNTLYLSGAREMIAAVAKRLGFTDESCSQMALAVDEALCNVIRHGYDRRPDQPIWISLWPVGMTVPAPVCGDAQAAACCSACPDALRIEIEDEARQVDPKTIKSRDLEEIRPGGLGVHIIHAVMDEVTYERRERAGMRLIMVKRRTSPARRMSGEERAHA